MLEHIVSRVAAGSLKTLTMFMYSSLEKVKVGPDGIELSRSGISVVAVGETLRTRLVLLLSSLVVP